MKKAIYFTATWCGPCQSFKPIMAEVMNEGYSVRILDIDKNEELAREYNVRSVPTTVIENDGVEVHRIVGGRSKSEMIAHLS